MVLVVNSCFAQLVVLLNVIAKKAIQFNQVIHNAPRTTKGTNKRDEDGDDDGDENGDDGDDNNEEDEEEDRDMLVVFDVLRWCWCWFAWCLGVLKVFTVWLSCQSRLVSSFISIQFMRIKQNQSINHQYQSSSFIFSSRSSLVPTIFLQR